ncbi:MULTISPECIES: hypothetical protein [unclassified Bifidobacterium]|uniref:hypothetical protein n=1 Tax=unclassified Bifidobacterium TaxID=2608897 RepID=UPI0015E3040A|nr:MULTISPECIES: hypothetical protein [unclassified Bifidobacterium]
MKTYEKIKRVAREEPSVMMLRPERFVVSGVRGHAERDHMLLFRTVGAVLSHKGAY